MRKRKRKTDGKGIKKEILKETGKAGNDLNKEKNKQKYTNLKEKKLREM